MWCDAFAARRLPVPCLSISETVVCDARTSTDRIQQGTPAQHIQRPCGGVAATNLRTVAQYMQCSVSGFTLIELLIGLTVAAFRSRQVCLRSPSSCATARFGRRRNRSSTACAWPARRQPTGINRCALLLPVAETRAGALRRSVTTRSSRPIRSGRAESIRRSRFNLQEQSRSPSMAWVASLPPQSGGNRICSDSIYLGPGDQFASAANLRR